MSYDFNDHADDAMRRGEIAKCPLCGNLKVAVPAVFGKKLLIQNCKVHREPINVRYECCGIHAVSLILWNQYAAAMALAKAMVKVQKVYHMPLIKIEGQLSDAVKAEDEAKEHVMEVFGKCV